MLHLNEKIAIVDLMKELKKNILRFSKIKNVKDT